MFAAAIRGGTFKTGSKRGDLFANVAERSPAAETTRRELHAKFFKQSVDCGEERRFISWALRAEWHVLLARLPHRCGRGGQRFPRPNGLTLILTDAHNVHARRRRTKVRTFQLPPMWGQLTSYESAHRGRESIHRHEE